VRSRCFVTFTPGKIRIAFRTAVASTGPGFERSFFALIAFPVVIMRVVSRTAGAGCLIVTAPFLAFPAFAIEIIRETVLAALAVACGVF
jgi:hypothetical protein